MAEEWVRFRNFTPVGLHVTASVTNPACRQICPTNPWLSKGWYRLEPFGTPNDAWIRFVQNPERSRFIYWFAQRDDGAQYRGVFLAWKQVEPFRLCDCVQPSPEFFQVGERQLDTNQFVGVDLR